MTSEIELYSIIIQDDMEVFYLLHIIYYIVFYKILLLFLSRLRIYNVVVIDLQYSAF